MLSYGSNRLKSEENDEKTERIFFAFYFSTLFSEKFNIPHDIK
jgi:hypothetical protein